MRWLFSLPEMGPGLVLHSIVWAVILSAWLYACVVLTGQTFGQRCAKLHPGDEVAQAQCVRELAGK